MGTKALEEALDNYEEWLHDTRQDRSGVKSARTELVLLRRSAFGVVRALAAGVTPPQGCMDVLASIAKEET
jgi:hypothetical protein